MTDRTVSPSAERLMDSLRLVQARLSVFEPAAVEHVVTESLTSGEIVESLQVRWRRPDPTRN